VLLSVLWQARKALSSSATGVYRHFCIRQHTSAYVSIRQHTSAYVSIRQHTSVYVSRSSALICESNISTLLPYIYNVSIRQHTSAYVSIRQHTLAVWRRSCLDAARCLCRRASPAHQPPQLASATPDTQLLRCQSLY
jgi:hypothetical protein